jgi:ribosome biogenesis GTPase
MEGLVLSGTNNLFIVLCSDGERRLCAIKGKRIKDISGAYNSLAAGDRVDIEPDAATPSKGLVTRLSPRRNVFGRFNEKGRANQAIAANVDLVVCVASPRLPPFRPRFVDRVAVLAEAAHVPFLVVLNKADLGLDEETEDRLAVYQELGYEVLVASAETGEGVEELRDELEGKTSVFAGQSGVGKSSLLNALEPGLARRTGAVSEKYDRGKHTTTMAELLPLADGRTWIADTPGVRRLALRGIEPDSLVAYFPELARLAPACAFGLSCKHLEEAGCAVVAAVESGAVHADRYESYLRIREELSGSVEYKKKEGRPRETLKGGRRPRRMDEDDE